MADSGMQGPETCSGSYVKSRWPPFASSVALGRVDTVDGATITAFYF